MRKIHRALISVSDKSGIVDFAKALHEQGITILSTGGTARLLAEKEIPVIEVSDYTGFPEIMDGRVKTLHPKIHGALLGRLNKDESVMEEHGMEAIGLVVVNLYPFEATINKPDCTRAEAIENIDIGGPSMLRAAAKNHERVGVVVDTADYAGIIDELTNNDNTLSDSTLFRLAQKTFSHTALYDANVANYLTSFSDNGEHQQFPQTFSSQFVKKQDLRYGENPHQSAAFYAEHKPANGTLASAEQIQGKELSYNNIADADAALEAVSAYSEPACVIVKHANPCGVAVADSIQQAYDKAYSTDPTSAFGGIIAFNRELDIDTAKMIIERQFVEVILAPQVSDDAKAVLRSKDNVRVMVLGEKGCPVKRVDLKRVSGGVLIQEHDTGVIQATDLTVVSERQPSKDELDDLLFAWKVVKQVKSNAIIYAKDQMTIGIGAGQMSRVYSARIAAIKAADAGLEIKGSVMASDAFFPFRDGIDSAAEVGVRAVIQPGGSMRDDEIIAAANEHDMAMVFTGMRHFLH